MLNFLVLILLVLLLPISTLIISSSDSVYKLFVFFLFCILVILSLSTVWAESYLVTHQPITTQNENVNGYGMDSSLGVLGLTFSYHYQSLLP